MKFGIAYQLKTPTTQHPAGTTVYRLEGHDYGLASDDTGNTGIEHVSVTLNADGGYPSFTYPAEDLIETPADQRRIIARFLPQAWQDDLAPPAAKPAEFDVTEHILALTPDQALAIDDDQYESDDLRLLPTAPQWVKDWSGPFCIEVSASIRAFYAGRNEIARENSEVTKRTIPPSA